jgi:hypothetical protein
MTREELEKLSRELADAGKLIEAGWVGLRHAVIPPDAPDFQVSDMRYAYMMGAQHLFASIMTMLEPGGDATTADLRRLDLLHAELDAFLDEDHGRTLQ